MLHGVEGPHFAKVSNLFVVCFYLYLCFILFVYLYVFLNAMAAQ